MGCVMHADACADAASADLISQLSVRCHATCTDARVTSILYTVQATDVAAQKKKHSCCASPIWPVQLIQVNIVGLQTSKAAINCFKDVLGTEGGGATSDPCHLC